MAKDIGGLWRIIRLFKQMRRLLLGLSTVDAIQLGRNVENSNSRYSSMK